MPPLRSASPPLGATAAGSATSAPVTVTPRDQLYPVPASAPDASPHWAATTTVDIDPAPSRSSAQPQPRLAACPSPATRLLRCVNVLLAAALAAQLLAGLAGFIAGALASTATGRAGGAMEMGALALATAACSWALLVWCVCADPLSPNRYPTQASGVTVASQHVLVLQLTRFHTTLPVSLWYSGAPVCPPPTVPRRCRQAAHAHPACSRVASNHTLTVHRDCFAWICACRYVVPREQGMASASALTHTWQVLFGVLAVGGLALVDATFCRRLLFAVRDEMSGSTAAFIAAALLALCCFSVAVIVVPHRRHQNAKVCGSLWLSALLLPLLLLLCFPFGACRYSLPAMY